LPTRYSRFNPTTSGRSSSPPAGGIRRKKSICQRSSKELRWGQKGARKGRDVTVGLSKLGGGGGVGSHLTNNGGLVGKKSYTVSNLATSCIFKERKKTPRVKETCSTPRGGIWGQGDDLVGGYSHHKRKEGRKDRLKKISSFSLHTPTTRKKNRRRVLSQAKEAGMKKVSKKTGLRQVR